MNHQRVSSSCFSLAPRPSQRHADRPTPGASVAAAGVVACAFSMLVGCAGGEANTDTVDGGSGATAGGQATGSRGDVRRGDSVSEQQFPSSYAETVCDVAPPCCRERGVPYDRARCKTVVMGFAQAELNETRASSRRYDPLAAGRCLAAIRASAKTCGALVALDDDDLCNGVFTGAAKPGEPCKTSNDCLPTSEGTPSCVYAANAGTCRLLPQAGESCVLFCAKANFCKAGTCTARTAAGAPCEKQNPLAPTCADGLFCDPAAKACTAKRTPGSGCTANDECQTGNCKAQVCSEHTRTYESQVTNLVTLFCSP